MLIKLPLLREQPLLLASQYGHMHIVRALLAAPQIDVNKACTTDGTTPLLFAAQNGNIHIVQALLAAPQIDVNKALTTDGATPLLLASQNGHLNVVQALLVQNAELEKTCKDGCTALLAASQNGHLEVVQALLQAGAKTSIPANEACPFGYKVRVSNGRISILRTKDQPLVPWLKSLRLRSRNLFSMT